MTPKSYERWVLNDGSNPEDGHGGQLSSQRNRGQSSNLGKEAGGQSDNSGKWAGGQSNNQGNDGGG